MTALSDLYPRIRATLHDIPGLVYDTPTLDEALRAALAAYTVGNLFAVRLEGLDGAADTSLPASHEALIVLGAAGYAARARAAEQAGRAQPEGDPAALRLWAESQLAEFQRLLASVFPALGMSPEAAAQADREADRAAAEAACLSQLRASAAAPWSAWTPWEE